MSFVFAQKIEIQNANKLSWVITDQLHKVGTGVLAIPLCLKVIRVAIAAYNFHTATCHLVETPGRLRLFFAVIALFIAPHGTVAGRSLKYDVKRRRTMAFFGITNKRETE